MLKLWFRNDSSNDSPVSNGDKKNETMTLDTHRTDTGCIHQEV